MGHYSLVGNRAKPVMDLTSQNSIPTHRLTVNPSRSLSAQVSRAFLKSPEAVEPDEDVDRTTASIIHSLPLSGDNRFLTSAFILGL